MPYVGGSLVSLFDEKPQAATRAAMRSLAERAVTRWQAVTTQNTPIDTGNLRTSWYTLPVQKVMHIAGPAYQATVNSDVPYAPHVEYGTGLWGPKGAKYPIRPTEPGGMLRWRDAGSGEYVYAREVMHPGSPGQHMLQIGAFIVEEEADDYGVGDEWVRAVEASVD